jgi:hypothetical protein
METRYILVEWPDSQAFMGRSDCYFCQCNDENSFAALDQAVFVPENIYKKHLLELENTEFNYGHNVNHKIEE